MLSSYFLVWAAAGALIFSIVTSITIRAIGPITVVSGILGGLLGWGIALVFMPAFDPYLLGSVTLFFFLFGIAAFASIGLSGHPNTGPVFLFIFGAIATIGIIFATTFSGFHAQRYANLLVPVQAKRDTKIPLIDQTQARLVTPELARKRAAELISSSDEQGIGSRVDIGEMWGNEVGGTMYWIAPLEHSGFFRWLSFGTTPGYVMVSQFNEVNAKFVQDKPIKIGIGAYMSDNIYRRLYMAGFVDYEYGDAIFQIDEQGQPYWVVPLLYPQIGFSGKMPVKWVVVNATTGDMETFDDPEKLPEWIDRVYPQDIVADRFDDWGCLSQGWMACAFTGQNVIRSTAGISVTIDPAGNIVYYSGTEFANAKSEGASSGLYVANSRTGLTTFYPRAGITEIAARRVMTQAFSNYDGYTAADPILLSVNGQEVYFSIILDGSGVRKAFSMVAQDNRNIIGSGDSVQAAVTEFIRASKRSLRDSAFETGSKVDGQTIEGLVVTYTPYSQNGKTTFYVSIDTMPSKIFEVSEEKIGEIVATKVGDPVSITAENYLPGIVYVKSFDNLRFELKEDGIQPIVDQAAKDAKARYDAARADASYSRRELP